MRAHELWVLSDELYHRLRYDAAAPSIATLPDMRERTVVVNGVSKTYAMRGWRIGFAAGPIEIIQATPRFQMHASSSPATMSQEAALTGDRGSADRMRTTVRRRRDLLVDGLSALPGLAVPKPAGPFFVFVATSGLRGRAQDGFDLTDGTSLATALLRGARVAVVPGAGFGVRGLSVCPLP